MMKAISKIIFLDEEGEKFFGEGPARLLQEIQRTGSLRAAAISMGMAYTKALKLLKHAEKTLGYALTTRSVGGKDGGGSLLTPEGREWLERYEAYRDACIISNQQLYLEHFGNSGCVIMASGLGKRFGGNKLMADFQGKPLISNALSITEKLFSKRVVVTRHADVAKFCMDQKIEVVLHDQPYRSDTIRLGLEALGSGIDSCLFLQSDQPLLRRKTILQLALAASSAPDFIYQAAYGETVGAPVLFPKWAFPELLDLPQGKGGGVLLKKYPEQVHTIQVQDPAELKDIDTPEDLAELLAISTASLLP